MSALAFNGTIAVRLFILSHFTYVKDISSCRQRTASAFGLILRGATDDGWWSAGRWFQTVGKASMNPYATDDENGANQHLIYTYIFMHNADASSTNDIMRSRISIGDWNVFSLDDISLLFRCYYLFALLHHIVAVVIGKILFVGS